MSGAIFTRAPEGTVVRSVPSLSSLRGSERVVVLESVLGEKLAESVSARAGLYLLDDSLAHDLRLRGLDLPENGELPALSPARWKKISEEAIPVGRLVGVLLSPEKKNALQLFLRASRHEITLDDLVNVARHYFYEDSLNLLVEYTAPRFNQS